MKVELPPGTKVTAVVAGSGHSLAVTSSGAVLAWGLSLYGALGNGSMGGSSDVPVNVTLPAGTKVTAVAAGALHSLALTSTGAVFAWGFNADGELGDGTTTSSDVPVKVDLPAGAKVTAVAAGGYYSLALTSTGSVFAWGYNSDGELGDGGTANSDVPVRVKVPGGTKVTAIAAGGSLYGVGAYVAGPGHSLAVTSGGNVFAWGYNTDGELGDGGMANSAVPVRVKMPAGTKVTAIAAGELQSLAVTSRGTVLAWGGNNFGQLGDGSYKGTRFAGEGGPAMRALRALGLAAGLTGNSWAGAARPCCADAGNQNSEHGFRWLQLRELHRGTWGCERHHCRAEPQLPRFATRGELNLRRRRHPIRQHVCPSVPRLHAAPRGPLLPIAPDKWHHKEHRERFGPSWGQDRVRGVTKRLDSDGLGN